MIDIAAIENAIFTWVQAASGYASSQIIFSDQDGIAPANSYITIKVGDLGNIGVDAERHDYDVIRSAGVEIRRQTVGMRDLMVGIQVFTRNLTTGDATARTIAAKIQAYLQLTSIRTPLNTAGLGVLNPGDVRWLPALDNVNFEGRALLEVLFCLSQGVEDFTGYITKVNAVPHLNGITLPTQTYKVKGVAPYDDFFHRDIP